MAIQYDLLVSEKASPRIIPRHSVHIHQYIAKSYTDRMGNICGKEEKSSDPFAQPGRIVGVAPRASHSSVPKGGTQGQKLGGSSNSEGADARGAAAKAAEVGNELAPRFKNYPDSGRLLTML